MTREETTTLGLRLVGAVGLGAGVSGALIALDGEDLHTFWHAARLVAIGVVALLAADAKAQRQGDETKRRRPSG
jgi:hypothetical protein